MRRLILSQVVATLVTVAIFLGAFTIFDVWQKSLDARVAAMSITFIVGYAVIILFRLLVRAGDWDRPIDVAFTAAAVAIIALMGGRGVILPILAISVWIVGMVVEDRKWLWRHPNVLKFWMQFLLTLGLLGWL